jgi:hypothetical protein
LLEMVPRRQGHGGQLKLVLDPPTILQKPTSSASSWHPFLLPSLPLPPFYDKAMPPKKWTRLALKTNGIKTRAAKRKELTRRQADLHASSLISQANAILSFCVPTDEGDVVSPGWV